MLNRQVAPAIAPDFGSVQVPSFNIVGVIDAIEDALSLKLLLTIWRHADSKGTLQISNPDLAALAKMSESAMRTRREWLIEQGFIAHKVTRLGQKRFSESLYKLFDKALTRGAPKTGVSIVKRQETPREKQGEGAPETGKNIHDSLCHDMGDMDVVNSGTPEKECSLIVGRVLAMGYNNLKDVSKFDDVPSAMVEVWLDDAKSKEKSGAWLQYMYQCWLDTGKPVPKVSEEKSASEKWGVCEGCSQSPCVCEGDSSAIQGAESKDALLSPAADFSTEKTSPPTPSPKGEGAVASALTSSSVTKFSAMGFKAPQSFQSQAVAEKKSVSVAELLGIGREVTAQGSSTPPPAPVSAEARWWLAAQHQAELQLDRSTFDTRMKACEFIGAEGNLYRVACKDDFARSELQGSLYRTIRRILADCSGVADVAIRFEVQS